MMDTAGYSEMSTLRDFVLRLTVFTPFAHLQAFLDFRSHILGLTPFA
jgi:hypothetical protein